MKKLKTDYLIGRWQLGWRQVDLYVMPYETGGWFRVTPGEGKETEMHIGLGYDYMSEVFAVMDHEAHELAMWDLGCSLRKCNAIVECASDAYIFMMDHNQHTEACARAGHFLFQTAKAVETEWKKAKKLRGTEE